MPVPLDVVKKYSPVFQFHEDEKCFPCSIEHLLHNSVLHYRNFGWPQQITGQSSSSLKTSNQSSSSTPALASFKGSLYIAYQDSVGFDFYISQSTDGNTWKNTQKIPGVTGGSPSLVTFQNKLWLVWHAVLSSELWIAHSTDGLHWVGIQKIKGQEGFYSTLTVYQNHLFLVYSHTISSELWMSQSADGSTWSNPHKIDGQYSIHPSITTFKDKVVMVYAKPSRTEINVSFYDQHGWSHPQVVHGQETASPVITTIGSWLFMVYSAPGLSTQLTASRSKDGITWQDTMNIPDQEGDVPGLAVYESIVYIAYRVDRNLWLTSCENGDLTIHEPIPNPTQEVLLAHSNESYYVKIDPAQFPGQKIPSAPMYYAVQEQGDTITIHYPILYANQTGQTCRALRAGTEFNLALETLGYHQGDLERVNITLQHTNNAYTVVQVGFEAHGDLIPYTPDKVKWEDGTHPIVHVALNGHASRNQDPEAGPIVDPKIPGIVEIGDFLGTGAWWKPSAQGSEFKLLGLDSQGRPIGDQLWAAFRGHLGDTVENSLKAATYFDGEKLSLLDWDFVETVFGFASVLNLVGSQYYVGDSPTGPNAWNRDWVTNSAG